MKNFITAILFMFMIGMVIEISPQSTDPPSKDQIEFHKIGSDYQVVSTQEADVSLIMVSPKFQLESQIVFIDDLRDNGPFALEEETERSKDTKTGYLDKHYDPGSCGNYTFI
jgi:hypothetical protein